MVLHLLHKKIQALVKERCDLFLHGTVLCEKRNICSLVALALVMAEAAEAALAPRAVLVQLAAVPAAPSSVGHASWEDPAGWSQAAPSHSIAAASKHSHGQAVAGRWHAQSPRTAPAGACPVGAIAGSARFFLAFPDREFLTRAGCPGSGFTAVQDKADDNIFVL